MFLNREKIIKTDAEIMFLKAKTTMLDRYTDTLHEEIKKLNKKINALASAYSKLEVYVKHTNKGNKND